MEPRVISSTPMSGIKITNQDDHSQQKVSDDRSYHKSLLTPCRRIGLKRKSASRIFNSPLIDNEEHIFNTETKVSTSDVNDNFSPKLSDTPNQSKLGTITVFKKNNLRAFSTQNKFTTSVRKIFTPVSTKSSFLKKHMLSKRLKMVENFDEETLNDKKESVDEKQDFLQLKLVLDKNYQEFLKLYADFEVVKIENESENVVLKHSILLEMKKTYDQIQKLKQSLSNAKQHDVENLRNLKEKWKIGCQKALTLLLDKLQQQGHNCDMLQLLLSFGIPHSLVNYDEDSQDFVT